MFCEPVQPVASLSLADLARVVPDGLTARIYTLDRRRWGMTELNRALLSGEEPRVFVLPGFGAEGEHALKKMTPRGPFGLVIDGYIALRPRRAFLELGIDRPHELLVGGVSLRRSCKSGRALGPGLYALELSMCLVPGDTLPSVRFGDRSIGAAECYQAVPRT